VTTAETTPDTAQPAEGATKPLLVILDSHGIIFRSYFALRDVLTTRRTGEPVAAVFGYANSLLTVFNEIKPTHVIAAWDAPHRTFREERDVRYKATRPAIPDDLPPQIERVRELLEAFRIPLIEKNGYEADDVVGTLACQAAERGIDTVIVTLDNDLIQLVRPGIRIYMYRPYQRDYVLYDLDAVRERWGFEPERMVDYKALLGDTSDNILGVRGVGEKGAKALIEQYGTIEEMLAHLDELQPPRTQKALAEGEAEARLSKELATIVCDVPGVELDMDAALLTDYDRQTVLRLFQELEFRSLISRLPESINVSGKREAAPGAAAVEGEYAVVTTPEQLDALAAAVRKAGRFAFEVIADDDHPVRAADALVGLALSAEEGRGWYVPFGHRTAGVEREQGALDLEGGAPSQLPRRQVFAALAPLFTDHAAERVAHNAKHGLVALAAAEERVLCASIDFDTQVGAYLLGDSNATLERLAFDRLGVELPVAKDILGTGRKATTFAESAPEDVGRYAAGRADVTLRLARLLEDGLQQGEMESVFRDIDLPHVPVLARMEQHGVAIDESVLREIDAQLTGRIAEIERQAYDALGHEFELGSPQKLSQVLFEDLGLPKTRRTKTGYTTDATALEPLRHVHPVVDAILNWRELTKIKSTYVDTLPLQVNPRTGRIHTIYSQVTAATGRLSSNDPNLQNVPVRGEVGQAVRRAFIARDVGPDPILLSVDYSQIELRVLAHIAADEELRRAFEERRDIHQATAANVFKVADREVTSEMRRRAKVFNFGVLYGLTGFGLSQREGIPREEADAFIARYFEAYPKVKEWRERTVAEARSRGYAETLTGRRRAIPDLHSSNRNVRQAAERIAINMPIQGTAADIIKIAMNRIDAEMLPRQEQGMRARMVLQVHDELIFELPRAELDDVREIAHRLMPSLELAVPLDLEEKWGRSWGDWELPEE
jgi:DNA polymerase-1